MTPKYLVFHNCATQRHNIYRHHVRRSITFVIYKDTQIYSFHCEVLMVHRRPDGCSSGAACSLNIHGKQKTSAQPGCKVLPHQTFATLCDPTHRANVQRLMTNHVTPFFPPGASVSLVLAVFGPPSAHGGYHNAVHVEPSLAQGRCVGLAQTTLQHVEKRLTHHLKKPKTNEQTGKKNKLFFFSCV